MLPKKSIFEIPISLLSKEETISFVRSSLNGDAFCRLATIGPEFLLRARKDGNFKENLLRADLRIADGFGITLAGWLYGKHISRFPGADLLHAILKEAEANRLPVFLAIGKRSLSSLREIQTALLKKYPALKITGETINGAVRSSREFPLHSPPFMTDCSVVFCNFGAPEQEYFLESLRGRVKSVRLAMGVGGAFDFVTGKLPRAPKWLRALGLEWLWRLFLQPSRWRRIGRAVIVFPMMVVKDKLFP